MGVLLMGVVAVFSAHSARAACHCSKVYDFKTVTAALLAQKNSDQYVVVEARVTDIPEVDPEWGFATTHSVGLAIENANDAVPEKISLKFPWAGECDPNPKLFELNCRYQMILEKTKDPMAPFRYPGTACEIGMRTL